MAQRNDKLADAGGRVVLAGILKNEAATIAASLDSVLPVIDCIALVDTGSTDETQQVIRDWMQLNNVPGVVYDVPWAEYTTAKGRPGALFDFAEARNVAQALACQHAVGSGESSAFASDRSWLLEIDACWHLRGGVDQVRDALARAPADVTGFELAVMQPGTRLPYLRLRRVSECSPVKPDGWRWRFAIHEALWRTDNAKALTLHGVWFDHNDTTTPEARRARFERDLLVLAAMAAEAEALPDTPERLATLARCAFYEGQTYENLGRKAEALAAYMKRAALSTGPDEWATALLRAGRVAHDMGDKAKAVQLWTESHAVGGRPEPLWYAAEVIAGMGDEAWSLRTAGLALRAAAAQKPESFRQFSDPNAYSLAHFGAITSGDALATRRLHMRLLGVGLALDGDGAAG